ncbi:glycosyltransferase [Actinocorallia longicatena]|uniref:Glycosyltransferase n=1 Tax=Actinocorallia longicatena TaxID=111803 RepID=A0ABP6QCU9_9ACTN
MFLASVFLVYLAGLIRVHRRPLTYLPGDPGQFGWHLAVPCRDEEAVIGRTVSDLRELFPHAHLWVIDDASEDATAAIVQNLTRGDERLHLVSRRLPDARTGKGDALNAAVDAITAFAGGDPDLEIVGVVDADGRLAPDALAVCAGPELFGDLAVGAVQVEVRMINRHDPAPRPGAGRFRNLLSRILIRMQDLEFRGPIAAQQARRREVGTVAMGGNGQFTRLSALHDLQARLGRIWGGSLVEDFELGAFLLLAGWETEFTRDTYVEQEALWSMRRWMAQRTRWTQGTMQCLKLMPSVWASPRFADRGVLEISYFLLQPWLNVIGSLVFIPLPIIYTVLAVTGVIDAPLILILMPFLYVLLSFAQHWVWGIFYQRDEKAGVWRTAGWSLVFIGYIHLVIITSWKALIRMIRGQGGWAKTRRNSETLTGPVAKEE